MEQRETALYLVFKVVDRLGQNWRALNGGENPMALVREAVSSKTASGPANRHRALSRSALEVADKRSHSVIYDVYYSR